MAVDTKAIKQKIKAVGNVRKVTKTMEMVSVAKMRKAVERKKASYEYAKHALEILAKISSMHDIRSPLFDSRKTGKTLLVIIGADKGLCGPYNIRIERKVSSFKKLNADQDIDVITFGTRAKKIATKLGLNVVESHKVFADSIQSRDLAILTGDLRAKFLQDNTYKKINIIYTEFISSLQFEAVEKQLLPMNRESLPELLGTEDIKVSSKYQYVLEPSEDDLLEELLPMLMQVILYQSALESLASEHSSRMLAMRNASDNASRMKDRFTGEYNRARQAGVTKEIIEIVNAASAV